MPRSRGQGIGESKTSPRRINTAIRRAEALKMRRAGASYNTIRDTLGYASAGAAIKDVQRALVELAPREAAAEVRALEVERLDDLWRKAWQVLQNRHVTVSQGRVVLDPDTGEKVADDAPVLQAIDRLLKIQERRAKLLGLDAPTKVEMITDDAIDREIRELNEQLAQLDRAAAAEAANDPGTAPTGN